MIKRALLLFLLLASTLGAKQYDQTIMAIQAKLFPKIALLEQHIKNSNASTLSITILAIETDLLTAKSFKESIESIYADGILNRKLDITVSSFKPERMKPTDAFIVLAHSPETLQRIADWANQNRVLTFAYDPYDLSYGLLVSIYFGKTTKPYLNRSSSNDHSFVFDPYFLKLAKFYE